MQAPGQGEGSTQDPVIAELLGVKLHTQLTAEESGEVSAEDSTAFSLKCNIDMGVNHLSEGLHLGLKDDREKTSAKLGRLVKFEACSRAHIQTSLSSLVRWREGLLFRRLSCMSPYHIL